jgi:hypothetical protein
VGKVRISKHKESFMKKVQVALYLILMVMFCGLTGQAQCCNTSLGTHALGDNPSGSYNTAIGANAIFGDTSGSYNTAIGLNALFFNTTGSANTGIGNQAGNPANGSLLTGMNNTALGTGATFSTGTLSNATAIGANAEVSESFALVLGSINGVNGQTVNTYVGIGTTAPRSSLDVDFSNAGELGPTITLTNPGGGVSAATSLDFNSYAPESSPFYNPAARIESVDAGGFTDNIIFQANTCCGANNGLHTTMVIYENGEVYIPGTLTKGSGSFKIDHPLDPANEYLYHSFVESPDMMNVYNGNITTNKGGLAVVVMPDYFEALNRDFRYQLTVIGQFAEAIVAKKIGNNRFVIRTNKPNVEVSWQVTGIRHDAYADAHRIQVEEEKPRQEQGHYLHPELFGAGPELAVGYRAPASPTQAESARVAALQAPPAARD